MLIIGKVEDSGDIYGKKKKKREKTWKKHGHCLQYFMNNYVDEEVDTCS